MLPETVAPLVSPPVGRTLRPRDAAAIMLLDRSGGDVRVLVGKRSRAHVFMPDLHVFPGGRRDAGDRLIRWSSDIHPAVLDRLKAGCGPRATESRLRALALAALRELHEEASIAIGTVSAGNNALPFLPDLANLRYIARAITPPGHPRRFDTHFFALFADEADIDPMDSRESRELEDLRWVNVNDVSSVTMPDITGIILGELRENLAQDPSLPFGRPVPFFHTRRGRFIRDVF